QAWNGPMLFASNDTSLPSPCTQYHCLTSPRPVLLACEAASARPVAAVVSSSTLALTTVARPSVATTATAAAATILRVTCIVRCFLSILDRFVLAVTIHSGAGYAFLRRMLFTPDS